MIIREQRASFPTWLLGGIALAGVSFSAYWWNQAQHRESEPASVVLATTATDARSVYAGASAAPDAHARPTELSPADWAALNTALATLPDPQLEAQRLASYMHYQQDFDFWQNSTSSSNATARHQLAEELLKQLPDRVAKGEFTGTEGMLMATVLINDMEANDAQRQKRIDSWGSQLNATAPQPTEEQELAAHDRETMHKRKRAEAFLAWQAKPADARPQADLNQSMADVERWFKSGAD